MNKIKVLVTDDNEEILDLFRRALSADEYETAFAHSGEEAIEIYQSFAADVVLLDIRMPGMDGIETLRRLKQLDDKDKSAVIMLTGYGELETAREAMTLGAYDYVTKPFDLIFMDAIFKEAAKEKVHAGCVS